MNTAFKSVRILIVDDEPDITTSLAWLLRYHGHIVEVVNDSRKAMQAIRDFQPRVVLLDICMPHVDGYDVARQIRKDPTFNDLLVVALSAFGAADHKVKAHQAGFNHQMLKPVNLDALNSVLAQLVQGMDLAAIAVAKDHTDCWQTLTRDDLGNLHMVVPTDDILGVRGLLWAAHMKHLVEAAGTGGTDIAFGSDVSEDAIRTILVRCPQRSKQEPKRIASGRDATANLG